MKSIIVHLLPLYLVSAYPPNPNIYAEEVKHLALKIEDEKKMKAGAYQTYGSSVMLYDKVKLLPPAPKINGAFFLKEAIHTESMELGIKMTASLPKRENDETESIPGFAMWFMNTEPEFPHTSGKLFGYSENFNGVGMFIYNRGDASHDALRLTVVQNHGTDHMDESRIIAYEDNESSCEIEGINSETIDKLVFNIGV